MFLDEIGELPLGLQKTFLRVIQEHRFRPVGGNQEIASNFRLVVATNRDLDQMVRQGTFREDLLFRLRSLVIALPPLRERLDDIKELTLHYMGALCRRFRLEPKGFSPDFWSIVHNYPWPGNVRELVQALEKALLSSKDDPIIFPKDLPTNIRIQVARKNFSGRTAVQEHPGTGAAVPPCQDLIEGISPDRPLDGGETVFFGPDGVHGRRHRGSLQDLGIVAVKALRAVEKIPADIVISRQMNHAAKRKDHFFDLACFLNRDSGITRRSSMQFLFFASSSGGDVNRIASAFKAAASGTSIEHFTTLADLEERLRMIVEPNSIAVLVAADKKELKEMQGFRDLVTDIYVILLIPDWRESTIKLAHLLRPRFLSQIQNDSPELNLIITKMIQSSHYSSTPAFAG